MKFLAFSYLLQIEFYGLHVGDQFISRSQILNKSVRFIDAQIGIQTHDFRVQSWKSRDHVEHEVFTRLYQHLFAITQYVRFPLFSKYVTVY